MRPISSRTGQRQPRPGAESARTDPATRNDRRAAVLATFVLGSVATLAASPTALAGTPSFGTSSNDKPAPCAAGTVGCPSTDPFYIARPARGLNHVPNGTVLRNRPNSLAIPAPEAASATTLIYRSTDTFGAPVLDSATVLRPTAPWTGTGPQPIVSWQFSEDSDGAQCRPSYAIGHPTTNSNILGELPLVDALLAQGIVVTAPDFEGPAETFEIGGQAGHAVLDGLRAAESQLHASATTTPIALTGYSGGAFATGWAAELATSYAPELHIVGAAMGGTPAKQGPTLTYLNGTAVGNLVLLAAVGLDRAYPGLRFQAQLTPQGRQDFAAEQGACVGGNTAQLFYNLDNDTLHPHVLDSPAVAAALRYSDLGTHNYPGEHAPTFPIFNYHVVNDDFVPYSQDQLFVKELCQQGTPTQHVPLVGEHIAGEGAGAPLMLAFIQARLRGIPFVSECPAILAAPALPQVPPLTAPRSAGTASPSTSPAPSAAPKQPSAGVPTPHRTDTSSSRLAATGATPGLAITALALVMTAALLGRRRLSRSDQQGDRVGA